MNNVFLPRYRYRHGRSMRKRFGALYTLITASGVLAAIPLAAIAISGWHGLRALPDGHYDGLAYSLSSGFYVPTTLQGVPIRVDADLDVFSVAFGTSGLVSLLVLLTTSYGLCLRSTEEELSALVNRRSGRREYDALRKRVKRCAVGVAFTVCCFGGSLAVAFPSSSVTAVAGIAVGVGVAVLGASLALLSYHRILNAGRTKLTHTDRRST